MCSARKEWKDAYRSRTVVGGVFRIRCDAARKSWLHGSTDLRGSQNRFAFSVSVGSCPEPAAAAAWTRHGPGGFTFEVLEELKKDETQTDREFAQDIGALFELWQERLREDGADEKRGGPPVSE